MTQLMTAQLMAKNMLEDALSWVVESLLNVLMAASIFVINYNTLHTLSKLLPISINIIQDYIHLLPIGIDKNIHLI
jgi:hypothetical protein